MNILTLENPRLRQESKIIKHLDPELKDLVQDLLDTVRSQKDPEGVGLAAPQIGLPKRVFVAKMGKNFVVFINPEITEKSKDESIEIEGCLSLPDLYGEVRRPNRITVRYVNRLGKNITAKYSGLIARIIQHEADHLNGILFLDLLKKQRGKLYRFAGRDKENKEIYNEISYQGIA